MVQRCRFNDLRESPKVRKLKRYNYGLKKSLRSWNLHFDNAIRSFGLIENKDGPHIYKNYSGTAITFLMLHVIDILRTGNDVGIMTPLKTYLSSTFRLKDVGEMMHIFEICFNRYSVKRLMDLFQTLNVEKMLKKGQYRSLKKRIATNQAWHPSLKIRVPTDRRLEGINKAAIPNASVIRSLMCASLRTRPNISHGICVLSRLGYIYMFEERV